MSTSARDAARGVVRIDLGSIERVPPGEGQTFLVEGREIAVFRSRDDVVHATQARCPHRAGLLADGIVGDGRVICPLHGYRFELASGAPVGNACAALHTFPVELTTDRRVLVWVPRGSRSEVA
ncbi:MAG TPA: Rieske (2Fe-2S) protein [Gemmatimonadaceae bacterium]|jgi:nitrite reductase (NADH) small subunit|nr:Rieske (2Fe-2S) protein [Gemmatimonadaceae bacterium]